MVEVAGPVKIDNVSEADVKFSDNELDGAVILLKKSRRASLRGFFENFLYYLYATRIFLKLSCLDFLLYTRLESSGESFDDYIRKGRGRLAP